MPLDHEQAQYRHGPSDAMQAQEAENKRLLSTIRSLRRQSGDHEWLVDQIGARVESMGSLPMINPVSRVAPRQTAYARPLAAVLAIADPHQEEVVDPGETEGLLEWNEDIWLRSMECTMKTAIELADIQRAKHVINDLHLFMLGDFVTGEIHSDVYFSNAYYLPDALTSGPWYWAQFVRELSAHFENVYVTCIAGNHGRLDQKPVSKRSVGRNWDTCMYQNTAIQTRNLVNVEWRIPRSPKCVVDVNGWYFLLQHGDQVAQHGGTTPYYGMARQRSSELSKRLGPRVRDVEERLKAGLLFDYDVRGHHHMYGTVDERTLLCPSMMGNNEFGTNHTFSHKMPGSRMFFVDEEHGMTCDCRINMFERPASHSFEPLPAWQIR